MGSFDKLGDGIKGLAEALRGYEKGDPAELLREDASAPTIPSWDKDVERGMTTMEEILGEDYGMMKVPEAPKMTITPYGKRIIPVRAVKRMSAREIGMLRRSMVVDQINEMMVSKLIHPLLKQLDEMGLIDLQINQVNPETLEYSITLNVVKDERD